MEVRLSEEFIQDLLGLRSNLQQKCWNLLAEITRKDAKSIRFQANPGWRLHQLNSSPFTSISVDMNYRMLCKLEGQLFRVCRVVKHDLADAAHINRNDGLDVPYVLDTAKIEAKDVYGSLVSMGLPEEYVRPFEGVVDEKGFIETLDQVDKYLQTYALGLYETTGLTIPRSKYTFFDGDNEFEAALGGSSEQWELYLHPSQQYIVELPVNYRLSVCGSAGTGKTVCAWYRIQHLARQGHSVGFVCPNKKIFEVSRHKIESLLESIETECYFLVPNSSYDIIQFAEEVEHIVVDEGQEFATNWFTDIGHKLTGNSTGITLFYDLNQLGGNIKAGDTRHLKHRLDTWHSRLNSIPGLGNMGFYINYRNSKEISEYYQKALIKFLPSNISLGSPLFKAGEVVVETVSHRQELGLRIASSIQALQRDYNDGEIGIIFNSYGRIETSRILRELRTFGIKTTTDIRSKNMILTASPRDIKGHERKAIIFCSPPMEQSTKKWGQAINVYVALSRARDRLIILESS